MGCPVTRGSPRVGGGSHRSRHRSRSLRRQEAVRLRIQCEVDHRGGGALPKSERHERSVAALLSRRRKPARLRKGAQDNGRRPPTGLGGRGGACPRCPKTGDVHCAIGLVDRMGTCDVVRLG